MTVKEKFRDGSDMLLRINGDAIGHCTEHSVSMSAETKDRAFKPAQSEPSSSSLWKGKGVTGLSINISASGLIVVGEKEASYSKLMQAYMAGESIEVECFVRGKEQPYLKGMFVITSLENNAPAQDDATFTIQLENDGKPEIVDYTQLEDAAE